MKEPGSRKERQAAAAARRSQLVDEFIARLKDLASEGNYETAQELWARFIRGISLWHDLKDQFVQHALIVTKVELVKALKHVAAMTPEEREAYAKEVLG